MAFTRVVIDTEELTANLGKEQLDLFDTKCIAALLRDTDSPKRARVEAEQVIAAASSTHLALAVENTFNVFTTCGELGYLLAAEIPDNATILNMKWLANSELLVLTTNKASLHVFSVATQQFVFVADLAGEWKSCDLEDFYNKRRDALALYLSADTGVVYRIVLDAWQTTFCRAITMEDAKEQLVSLFTGCSKKMSTIDMGQKRFEKMIALSFTTVGGVCVDGRFRQVQQLLQGGPMKMNMEMKDVLHSCVRAHFIGNDTILAVLTKEGNVEFVDVLTMTKTDQFLIPRTSNEVITDFAFLEWPGADATYERIAIIVEKNGKTQVQIRQMDSLGVVSYSHTVVTGSFLIQLGGPSAESERLAMVVEPVDETLGYADQQLCLREVVETQPKQRLARLITRNLLDEAERFALENKLDVQLVHAARVALLLQQLHDSPDEKEYYEGFMKAVDKVDDDSTGEWVLGAISSLRNAEWISRLLEYAEAKNITEPSATSLSTIAYNFATYRMVFGPNAAYGKVWAEYQQSAEWVKQWINLLQIGNVAAARIIWHRYPMDFVNEVHEGIVIDAFIATKEMLQEFPLQWQFAIDHLESDVMSLGISNCQDSSQLYDHFIDLIVHIATMLERHQPESFPDNALYAVSAVERLIDRLKKNAITAMKSAEFLSTSSKSVAVIEEMYKRSRDLRAIKRLKEVYECPLSYEQYKALSTKEICHEILQRSVQNPAQLRDRIDRIARPFMEEHSLPADETLLGHIEKVTSIARCQTSSEPLDVHCLLVTDAIASAAVRARAVLNIAGNAPIPWCSKLRAAVQQVLNDDHIDVKIKKELNLTQDRMNLGKICQDYGLTRDYVDAVVDTYGDLVGFIRYLLTGERTSATELSDEERFEIAAETVAIYDRLRPGSRPKEVLRVDMREYVGMLIERSDLAGLHRFVERHGVIDEVIDLLVTREETEDYGFDGDKDWMTRRSASLVAINSLIQRHRRDDVRWKNVYEEMRKMLKLMTKYNMDVSLVVLRESGMRANLLHKFMRKSVLTDEKQKLRECIDLTEVLGMTHDEAFLALLDYSVPMCSQKMETRIDQFDLDSGLYLARKAVLEAKSASVQLLQHVVHVAEQIMRRMIPLTPTTPMSMEQCEKAFEDAFCLSEILPVVLRLDVDMMVADRVLRMNRPVRLILEAVQQMQQSSSDSQNGSTMNSRRNSIDETEAEREGDKDESEVKEEKKKSTTAKNEINAALKREANLIGLSNRRRIGIYEPSMDNPIMDAVDTMRAVCGIAFMMYERPDTNKNGEARGLVEQMEERWAELFSDLNLAGQHLLEMHARVLYAVWGGRVEEFVLLPLTGAFAERLVTAHPCDLPLLATIFATLDDKTIMDALKKLVLFSKGQRKAPQTILNVCRLAQLMLSRKERCEVVAIKSVTVPNAETPVGWTERAEVAVKGMAELRAMFSRALWEKTLGKKGVVAHSDAHRAVVEFAAHLVQPETVREYLLETSISKMPQGWGLATRVSKDMKVQLVCGGMRTYLAALLNNAGKAAETFDREGILVTADLTIELERSQSSYDQEGLRAALLETLYQFLDDDCCPYEHEVIQFVLAKIAALADSTDDRWKAGKKVADFICLMPRAYSISDAERVWYTERRAQRGTDSVSLMGDNMMADETQLSQMPPKSKDRLPFHLFLCSSEVEMAKFVVPLVWHEITLVSMSDWYTLLKDVHSLSTATPDSQKMELKRTKLITKAVMKYIRAAQEQDDQLSASDMEWIQERLYEERQVLPLIHSFFLEVSQFVPVGATRIQLMQLGYNVTKKFLEEHTEDTQNRRKIDEHRLRTLESLREMSTKQLLQKHRVYNQETSPHIKNVDALISRIYDCFINWDEPMDVEKKCALIKELVGVNEHDIESTHEAIVQAWLSGEKGCSDGDDGLPDVDMNDTMGSSTGVFGGGSSDGNAKVEDDDHLPIPFYDEEVTRIVHVVRLSKRKQRLVQHVILNLVNMSSPPGGLSTHIRAVCTLLRALTTDELAAWAPEGIDDYAAKLETRLNKRLVERSLGASAYPQFAKAQEKAEKLQLFIRNLLTGTHRTRPGTVHLATVLTMDFFDESVPVDQKIIDHMLSKLNSERKYALLAVFLKFCSSHAAFRQTRNLNVLWGRTIESAMRELEDESASLSSIHEWLLFALSCPTPGNRALESLKRLMEMRGANVGGYLIKLASSYTKTFPCPPSEWSRPLNIDYPLQWAATNNIQMEED